MKLYHKTPCAECPWRRASPAGYLGGQSAEMYADAVQCNEVPACHLRDNGPDSPDTAFCAGALRTIANQCVAPWKAPGARDAANIVGKGDDCFGHAAQFYRHHADADYVPYVIRMMQGN